MDAGFKPTNEQDELEEHVLENAIVYILLWSMKIIFWMPLSLKYRDLLLLEVSSI